MQRDVMFEGATKSSILEPSKKAQKLRKLIYPSTIAEKKKVLLLFFVFLSASPSADFSRHPIAVPATQAVTSRYHLGNQLSCF